MVFDTTGAILEEVDNNPFGDIRFSNDNPTIPTYYALHERNDATGLIDMEARYYDPATAQFTSIDPASLYNPEQFILDPQQLHTYAYARNNPVRWNDPTGEASIALTVTLDILLSPNIAYAPSVEDEQENHATLNREASQINTAFFVASLATANASGLNSAGKTTVKNLIKGLGEEFTERQLRRVASRYNWRLWDTLADHASRHAKDFGLQSNDIMGYAKAANKWIQSAIKGVAKGSKNWMSGVAKNGKTYYFNKKTGMMGVLNKDGTIATVYKPDGDLKKALAYYLKQIDKK